MRVFMRRIEIKIAVKGSMQANVKMIHAIKEVFSKLQETDSSFIILPYCSNDTALPTILKLQHLPNNIGKLKKYFWGATPRLNGSSYFLQHLSCINSPFSTIMENIGWRFGANKAGTWMRKVQRERTTWIGVLLLYSLRSTNEDHMMRILLGQYNTKIRL